MLNSTILKKKGLNSTAGWKRGLCYKAYLLTSCMGCNPHPIPPQEHILILFKIHIKTEIKYIWVTLSNFWSFWQCSWKVFFTLSDNMSDDFEKKKLSYIYQVFQFVSKYQSFSDDQTICLMIFNKIIFQIISNVWWADGFPWILFWSRGQLFNQRTEGIQSTQVMSKFLNFFMLN